MGNEMIIKYQVTNLTSTPTFLNMLILNATEKNHYLKIHIYMKNNYYK